MAPRLTRGQTQGIEPFLFVPFDSFLYSVDILGYSFMSVATLCAARVLLPFIALQMYAHWLIWLASLWAVTFPGATWSLAILFRDSGRTAATRDASTA